MKYEPHSYQKFAIEYLKSHPVSALFLDCGLGKTSITLTAIEDMLHDSFEVRKVLVIAPVRVAKFSWPDEIKKWDHLSDIRYSLAFGTEEQRIAALNADVDIYIINRENIQWLVEKSGVLFDFDMLVIDELTLLETVRELKLFGIDVFFEEQNIHTISADGELMMTILASYAQAESLSASENQKWRIRKAFENGEIVNLRFLFGYRINGAKIEIDPAQADIVREVFERAVNGESFTAIAKDLNNRNITRCLGGKWNSQRIRDLLSNEKYLGNSLLQKKYRNNHLEKKLIHNDGQLPKYYAEGTHDAIVDEELFAKTQDILCYLAKRRETLKKPTLCAFSGMIVCDNCGAKYKRTTSKGKHAWQCKTFLTQGKAFCPSRQIPEEELYRLATEVLKLDEFDKDILHRKIKNIRAKNNCTLLFYFTDGTEVSKNWVPRTRKNSWTAEMRECARQRVLNQRGKL